AEMGRSARTVIGRRWPSSITLPPIRSIHSATIRSGDASCARAGNNAHASRHGATRANILVTLLDYYKARQSEPGTVLQKVYFLVRRDDFRDGAARVSKRSWLRLRCPVGRPILAAAAF